MYVRSCKMFFFHKWNTMFCCIYFLLSDHNTTHSAWYRIMNINHRNSTQTIQRSRGASTHFIDASMLPAGWNITLLDYNPSEHQQQWTAFLHCRSHDLMTSNDPSFQWLSRICFTKDECQTQSNVNHPMVAVRCDFIFLHPPWFRGKGFQARRRLVDFGVLPCVPHIYVLYVTPPPGCKDAS